MIIKWALAVPGAMCKVCKNLEEHGGATERHAVNVGRIWDLWEEGKSHAGEIEPTRNAGSEAASERDACT